MTNMTFTPTERLEASYRERNAFLDRLDRAHRAWLDLYDGKGITWDDGKDYDDEDVFREDVTGRMVSSIEFRTAEWRSSEEYREGMPDEWRINVVTDDLVNTPVELRGMVTVDGELDDPTLYIVNRFEELEDTVYDPRYEMPIRWLLGSFSYDR